MNRLLISYLFTSSSAWMFTFLVPLLFLSIKASPLLITMIYAVSFTPYLIVTPFAGAFSDRFNKKNIILFGELLAACTIAIIAMMNISIANTPIILLLVFIASCGGVIHHPTFQAIIPVIVESQHREKFNSKINGIDNIVGILAPLGAASLFTFLSHQQVLLLCIALYSISFAIITTLPYRPFEQAIKAKYGILRSILEGFQYVYQHTVLKSAVLVFVVFNFGVWVFFANIPYVFIHEIGGTERMLSICYSMLGIGALCGSFLSVKLMARFSYGTIIVNACLIQGLCYLVASFLKTPYWIAFAMAFSFALNSCVVVSFFTLRQKIVSANLLGRVTATTRLLAYATVPLGALTGGYILNAGGNYQQLLIVSTACIIIAALYGKQSALSKA